MHNFLLASPSSLASSVRRGQNSLLGGGGNNDQWWLTESPVGSRPSSVITEPYISTSFVSPRAHIGSMFDIDSSPIAAQHLYRPPANNRGEAVAALSLHCSNGDTLDGPLEIPLYAGVSRFCGTIGESESDRMVRLPVAQVIDATIDISDGLHVLSDRASESGVFLGHRRVRLRPGAGYVITDGKLVWFGGAAFWYRVLDDTRRSVSPLPPWLEENMRGELQAIDNACCMPHESPPPLPAVARPAALKREVAAAAISQSPLLPLLKSPEYGSDYGEEEFPLSPPRMHLGLEGLRVDVLGSDSDECQSAVSRAPTEVLSDSGQSAEPEVGAQVLLTQPVSPSRQPPHQVTAGSRTSSMDNEASAGPNGAGGGSTQVVGASPDIVYLPQPSALVCAPSRVILVSHDPSSLCVEQAIPRYPYDVAGMELFLRSATQYTSPTQPDPVDNLSNISVETVQSSDFSQAFISPPPPPPQMEKACTSADSVDAPRSRCHRRSIDNYTDEEEESHDVETPAVVVVSETPAKRAPRRASSRSGSRLSTPSTSALSLASSSSSRATLRFSTPTSMSQRLKHARHPPLNLRPSPHILRTPLAVRSAGAEAPPRASIARPPRTASNDGFPPDGIMGSGALLRSRRYTQGSTITVNAPLVCPRTPRALESPMSVDSPLATACAIDDVDLSSSPSLPNPSTLLQSPVTAINKGPPPPVDRDPFADNTQLDHADSIVPEKPPPRIHLRVPIDISTPSLSASSSSAATAGDGWINMDDASAKPPKSRTALKKNSTGQQTNLAASLRKLPGKPGSKRTGLSTTSRKASVGGKKPLGLSILPTRAATASSSHRNLELAQTTKSSKRKSATYKAPSTPPPTSNGEAPIAVRLVMVTGFVGDDLARVTRQLEAQGLSTTANPLTADVCVRQGARLGRTLKVLCALARGIPIVSPAWVNDLESKPLAHLVVDRDTEREWDFSLADTLRRACAGPLLSGLCVYVAPSVVTRPNPVCLAVMAKAAGGFVLNDFARDEECLLRGEEANGVPLLNRRCSSSVDNDREGVLTCDESSEEPDNDSDEDWSATNNHPRTRASRRKRRKTLPKLPKVDYESSQNDDARRVGLKSEPSMIFAPPISAATTPIRATAGNSPSSRLSLSATSGKRRKIRESPASVSSSTNFGTVSEAGSASVAFDPKCSAQDMAILLAARKDELGIPADTQLLVVEAAGERLRSLWRVHGALVVEPEAIIQSIIHCSRQF